MMSKVRLKAISNEHHHELRKRLKIPEYFPENNEILGVFYKLFVAINEQNQFDVIQCFKTLELIADLSIIPVFQELEENNVIYKIKELFRCCYIGEVLTSAIQFIDKLMDTKDNEKQPLFELIVKDHFCFLLIDSIEILIPNKGFCFSSFDFLRRLVNVYLPAKSDLLQIKTIEQICLFFNNPLFDKELQNKLMLIFNEISKLNLSQLEQGFILNFIKRLIVMPNCFGILNLLLKIPKNMINNSNSCHFVLVDYGFFNICNQLIQLKQIKIIIKSLELMAYYYLYQQDKSELECDYNRLLRLSQSSNDDVSYSSFRVIRIMMENDQNYILKFIDLQIIKIINKVFETKRLRTKIEIIKILNNIILNCESMYILDALKNNAFEYLLSMISLADINILDIAIPPFLAILDQSQTKIDFMFCWDILKQNNGMQLILNLMEDADNNISSKGKELYQEILNIKNRIEKYNIIS